MPKHMTLNLAPGVVVLHRSGPEDTNAYCSKGSSAYKIRASMGYYTSYGDLWIEHDELQDVLDHLEASGHEVVLIHQQS